MSKKYKGRVQIGKKFYDVEVKNGERFIDGKTIYEFMETLNEDDLLRMAVVGKMAINDERIGIKPPKGKYQYYSIV